MDVLAVIHGETVRSGVFGDAVEARGHRLEEWSLASGTSLPRPLDAYGAVFVLGGAMHADQEGHHPWLREENLFLQRLLDIRKPVLGVCLGAQLLAKAAGAPIGPASEPEIGWCGVELTDDAADDPVLGDLPVRFDAFQWHYYKHGLPAGAVELARNDVCTQAFRLGDSAWGVQFHPEVTFTQVEAWMAEDDPVPPGLLDQTRERIGDWNELGKRLCDAFVAVAERVATPA
ncbi:MAG TPA: type 1 glutamine amidotransferase [Gaiellaceae bacterium]|nr:type 1 glutamine amidotransferase [Gaiellaceae bacterium]